MKSTKPDSKVEFGLLRKPDKRLEQTFDSLEEAAFAIKAKYNWKADRFQAAEENRDEFDQHEKGNGPFPPTNEPKFDWDIKTFGGPPIKDMEWVIVRREITAWKLLH